MFVIGRYCNSWSPQYTATKLLPATGRLARRLARRLTLKRQEWIFLGKAANLSQPCELDSATIINIFIVLLLFNIIP